MGFAAINAADHQGEQSRVRETLEAQESRVANTYATGLRLMEEGRRSEALGVFEGLLTEALMHTGGRAASISAISVSRLRYLVLRNLASLLAGEDASAPRALSLYAQALMLDDGDSVVWNHMGTLAAELGRWGVARMVFEHGLQQYPKHAAMMEKLVEVLMQLGDWQAAQPALARMLAQDPTHPRALQLQGAVRLAQAGTVMEGLASPFKNRAASLELHKPQQDGPLVLTITIPTWAALLRAVISALEVPRQLQGQSGRQDLRGVEFRLSPEQQSSSASEESEEEIDIMSEDDAAATTQTLEQPAPAEQSLAVGGSSSWAAPTNTSETAQAAQPTEQARMQPKDPPQATEKGNDDAGRPPPARVSRRLEARREGQHPDMDAAGEDEEVNIIAELRPFLPHQPPVPDKMPSTAAEAPVPEREPGGGAQPRLQGAMAEEQAVRDYIATNDKAVSLHAAGISLMNAMVHGNRRPWAKDTAEQTLALASALGCSWRPEGEIALTLAELGLDAADAIAEGQSPTQPFQQTPMQSKDEVGSKAMLASIEKTRKAPPKRRGAEHSAVAKLLARSEECLGHYLMSRILHGSTGLSTTGISEEHVVRHLWVSARTAEMHRDLWTATKHYAACLKHLQEREAKHCGSADGSIRLPHYHSDLVISSFAAQAKLDSLKSHQVLETAKANGESGRADLVIAELSPLLLDEAGIAGKGPLSKKKTALEGLQVLQGFSMQDAAVVLKDASCELKCRLAALKWLLPPIPDHMSDLAAHTTPVSGPPPAQLGDLQRPFRSIAVQAITDLAEFVAAHRRAGDLASLAAATRQPLGLLQHVQWQAVVLLEAAFWSLCGSQAQAAVHTSRTMSTKTAARQAALLAACMGLCALHRLELATQPISLDSISQEERVLAITASFLARRDILDLQRGAFVRLALGCFANALSDLKGFEPDQQAAREELILLLNSNVARCLQLLFGVTLPDRNMEWGAPHAEVAEDLRLENEEECIEAWQHIKSYAESLEKDSKALGRLQGVLEAIGRHFNAPPASVLEAWDPAKLLDSMPFDRSDVYSRKNSGLIMQLLQQPAELLNAVAHDAHANIHRSLHRLLDILKPDVDAALKFGEGLSLEDRGAEVTESVAALAAYDLRYNPRSLRSWDSLANTYKEAASNILNEAAEAYSVDEFHERPDLKARFATYQQRALWASLAARQVASEAGMTDDVAILDEQIGNILYEELQDAPPFSDQLMKSVHPHAKKILVQNAAQAYQQAWSGLPDEWLYACYSGKLQAKLGAHPEDWLYCMAKAVCLSVQHVGGLVEPFFQLHSQRLKVLLKPQPTTAELRAVSRYCSLESAADEAAAVFSSSTSGDMSQEGAMRKVKDILIADCTAAMRFCLECDKQYHKAAFHIGRALAAQLRTTEAVQQLQSLFFARHKFCINIWEIQGGASAKSPTPSEASAKDVMTEDTDDSLWGRQPGTVSGNGLNETYRKFAAARRKYMLLYFELLHSTERFDMLLAGHTFLQSTVWGSPAMMADMARIALARCVTGVAIRLMQHRQQMTQTGPSRPVPAQDDLLQLCFTLYTEYLLGPEARFSAADILSTLPDTPQAEQDAVAWALKEGFRLAVQQWVAGLGANGDISRLQELLAALRKNFKMMRSAPEEIQALAQLAAGYMAHAIDRSLTCLGAPPYKPMTTSASAEASQPEGSRMPSTIASPTVPDQQPGGAPPVFNAASLLPTVASTALQASSAAHKTSAVPPVGAAQHLLVLLRLGIEQAVAVTLLPYMPQILLHLLPGTNIEKQSLHTMLLHGHNLSSTWGPQVVQQLNSSVQRNAFACFRLLSAAPGQAESLGGAATLPAPTSAPGCPPPNAAVPAPLLVHSVQQVPSASQGPALLVSMAEPSRPSHTSAVLLGDARAADSSASPPAQASSNTGAPVQAGQQMSCAVAVQGVPAAPEASIGASVASAGVAMKRVPAYQQPPMTEESMPVSSSPTAQDSQAVETLAEKREEAFELMRFSRFLHKSGMTKLPAQQDQPPTVKEGLEKIDGNMVRAYLLYLRTTGEESKAGLAIKAADAATGYEEVAKALKQASPAKTARAARERPGPGASTDREEVGDLGVEARLDQDGHAIPAKRRRRGAAVLDV